MKNIMSLMDCQLVEENADSLRIFWKIIIDADGGTLRAVKEVALWGECYATDQEGKLINAQGEKVPVGADGRPLDPDKVARRRHRFLWKQVPLRVEIGAADKEENHRNKDRISVEDGYIYFRGGYLRIFDTGLLQDAHDWLLELDPARADSRAVQAVLMNKPTVMAIQDHLRKIPGAGAGVEPEGPAYPTFAEFKGKTYYAGYNVRLEADFALEEGAETNHPIFFFRQDPADPAVGNVSLDVSKRSNQHEATWGISRRKDYKLHPYYLREPHSFTVNQDRIDDKHARFSFLADALPLITKDPSSSPGHAFSKDGGVFYVGFFPDGQTTLRGYVRRIVFDPNASCLGCAV